MSASPADRTPGRTPNGGVTPVMRRPKKADPLVRPKPRKPLQSPLGPTTNGVPGHLPNGLRTPTPGQAQVLSQHPDRPSHPAARPFHPASNSENISSGFSSPPVAQYHDYSLVLSKQALMEGFRHHVARFSGRRTVDPRNAEEFVRPVRLHRRDPRAPPGGGGGVKNEDQVMGGMDDMDDIESERQRVLKAEREAQREADMAQVAPAANTAGYRKIGHNMKKTEQIWRNDQTEEQKAQSKLRYEEALPWHLEDFDNKSTWVGTYEAALSDTYGVMFLGQDNVFRMIPLEKWYKFTQKNQFKTLTIEEAESHYERKTKDPRWFMEKEKVKEEEEKNLKAMQKHRRLYIGRVEKDDAGGGEAAPVPKDPDADDIDFQEDRFADDEENMVFEEDDETKEAEERIKKDQLKANVFDLKPEKEYEKQEELEKKEKDEQKAFGKRVKKALMKREKNYNYDDDSSDNPYSSESESESTETERLKEEERKKAEENKSSPEKDKLKTKNSGYSSKDTNNPSHRPSKHSDSLKRSTSSNSLKRPGSPVNSEASGNESTRKRPKNKHAFTSCQPQSQANNTLQPPSHPDSPALPPLASQPALSRKSSNLPAKRLRGTGSGSDSEGGAGSGGEISDGTRKRVRLELGVPSKNGTPQGSRSGSPEVPNVTAAGPATRPGKGNSRAGSPVSLVSEDHMPFPTGADIRAVVPPNGLRMSELLAHFKGQISGEERKNRFIKLMKENTRFEKVRKILLPLEN